MKVNALEAQAHALASMMAEKYAALYALSVLAPHDFTIESYRATFQAMKDCAARNEPVDFFGVGEQLRRNGHLDRVGGSGFLLEISGGCPSFLDIERYCKQILNASRLRQLKHAGQKIQEIADDADDSEKAQGEAEKLVRDITIQQGSQAFIPVGSIVKAECARMARAARGEIAQTGTRTGFIDLDDLIGPLQRKDLIVVGGRPSMGKTAMCMEIAEYVATHEQMPAAVFSLEMAKEQLVRRMIAGRAKVNSRRIESATMNDEEWRRVGDATAYLKELPLFIHDLARASTLEMRSQALRLQAEHGDLGVVIVDHIQLARAERNIPNRVQELGEIAHDLKHLAREVNAPVIVLSQLSRGVEQREDKRPVLSDLRESGDIEQDADIVMFVYRDDYYRLKAMRESSGRGAPLPEETEGKAEVLVRKHRNGPTGTVELSFIPEFARFENLARGGY